MNRVPNKTKICELYVAGHNSYQIAPLVGSSIPTVCRIIKAAGLTRSKRERNSTYSIDIDYFKSIDTEQKAYWLGFLMADGCIMRRRHPNGKPFRAFRINLGEKDYEHLTVLREHICAGHPLKRNSPNRQHRGITFRLAFACEDFVDNLLAHGWDDFKSSGKWVMIDKSLQRHQLRGFMDGDGWVTQSKTCNPAVTVGFCSEFDSVLQSVNEITGLTAEPHSISTIRSIQYHGAVCHDLHRLLYDGATVWLPRKRKRFEELLSTPKTVIEGICWCGRASKPGRRSCQTCITNAVERNRRRRLGTT